MSSFLCFICHSTVNDDTTEEMREKYREVIGMNLCPDSHLCHICCHVMNRLWLFRSVCLKRSLEYPVLFSEKGTLNLQRNYLEIHTVCSEDCEHYKSRNVNSKYYNFTFFDETYESCDKSNSRNDYCELEDERQEFDELFNNKINYHDDSGKNVENSEFFNENEYNRDNNDYNQNDNDYNQSDNDYNCNTNSENNTNYNRNDEVCEEFVINKENGCTEEESQERQDFVDGLNDDNDYCDEDIQSDQEGDGEENYEYDTENIAEPSLENNPQINETDAQIETTENEDPDQPTKKKKKKKSKKGKDKNRKKFEKILLSIEEQKSELESKRKEKKYIEAEFKCFACAQGFLFKDTYQAHMMRHEESNGEYQCLICGLRFATQAVLRAHRALHAERHRCLRCDIIIRRRQRTSHASVCYDVPRSPLACPLCARACSGRAALAQHLRRAHAPARVHACTLCGEAKERPHALRTHMIKHIQRSFPCSLCPRVYRSPHSLRAHAATAHAHARPHARGHARGRERPKLAAESFSCPICGVTFASQRSLASHTASLHSTETPYSCPACPKRYGTRKSLTRHMHSHRPAVKSAVALCHLCGGSFKGNSKLNRHLREVCGKDKLEEELSTLYTQGNTDCRMNSG